jgi:hypothetical protein
MKNALKKTIVPRLRELGFSGSFPHLRRCRPDRIDLLTFQFDRHGGGFVLEIGQCPPNGFKTFWGKQIVPDEVTVWDLSTKERARLKPRNGSGTDSWFRYDDTASESELVRVAESVLPFVEQAERMFDDFDRVPRIG